MSSMDRIARKERQLRIKKKRRKRVIFIILEVIVLCILSVVAYGMHKMSKINHHVINPSYSNENLDLDKYTNIALFGVDARAGETTGVRTDAIIVASINNDTKEIKLLSVFRDTFLQQKDGTYFKANEAYATGGAEEAVEMLNKNLDLNIKDYATVNFKALADAIDLLGGIEMDLTYEEIVHLNNYCVETSEITGLSYDPLPEEPGKYKLNGVQAVSYSRIRYTEGGDYKRAERQRTVINKIVAKAKKAGIIKLNKIIDAVLPEVTTSLSMSDIIKMAEYLITYDMGDSSGFPFDVATPESVPGYTGSFVVPVNLEQNVRDAHKFLFPDEEYNPSDTITSISNDIIYITGIDNVPDETQDETGAEDAEEQY